MQVIISGINRVEFCTVNKKKDLDRRFFMTRGQLYLVPPDGLVRMRVIEYGKKRPSEAVIMYKENEIVPYETFDKPYTMNNLLNDIDRYKQMTNYSWLKGNQPWFISKGKDIWKLLTSGGGIMIVVLLYVFIKGGLS